MLSLENFKSTFDTTFDTYLQKKISHIHQQISEEKIILDALHHTKKICLGGGKRIRPYMSYVGYVGYGGNNEAIIDATCSLELIHSLALMVDDIIDKSTSRHGVETLHSRLQTTKNLDYHTSCMVTVLVSDILYNRVFDNYSGISRDDFIHKDTASKYLNFALEEVIVGEIIDVLLQGKNSAQKNDIEQKDYLKTASYTFIRPLQFGGSLAGAEEEQINKLGEIGKYLGLGFQLMDDVGDILGLHKGKPTMSDIQEGQQTQITVNYLDSANNKDKQEFLSLFGKKLTNKEKDDILRLYTKYNSIQKAKKQCKNYIEKANGLIFSSSLSLEAKKNLMEIGELVIKKLGA